MFLPLDLDRGGQFERVRTCGQQQKIIRRGAPTARWSRSRIARSIPCACAPCRSIPRQCAPRPSARSDTGMKSMTRTRPRRVRNSVSRTSESSTVSALRALDFCRGRQQPASMLSASQQRREARGRSRTAGNKANRSSHCCPPRPRCGNRLSMRSPRSRASLPRHLSGVFSPLDFFQGPLAHFVGIGRILRIIPEAAGL